MAYTKNMKLEDFLSDHQVKEVKEITHPFIKVKLRPDYVFIEMQDEKTVEKLTRACYMNGSDIISPACGLGMGSDLHNVQAVLRTVRTFTE